MSRQRRSAIRRFALPVVVLAAALAAVLATSLSAAAPKPFQAVISPVSAIGGATGQYSYTITNLTSQEMGSANVTVAAGWTVASVDGISTSAGKAWTATLDTAARSIELRNNGPASTQRLGQGQSVTVTFTATAPCAYANPGDPPDWSSVVKQANNFNGSGNDFYLDASLSTIEVDLAGGCPDHLRVSPEPATTDAGQTISAGSTFTVRVEDSLDQLVTGTSQQRDVTVALVDPPAGVVLGGATTVTSVGGVATFTDLTITKTGTYQLIATASGLTSDTSASFTVTPAAPDHLRFLTQPANTPLGEPISPTNGAVQVQIEDQYDNLVDTNDAGDQREVSIGITSGTGAPSASLTGTTTVMSDAGIAEFSDLEIDELGQGYTLDATSAASLTNPTTLTGATSTSFDITPGYAVALVVDDIPNHLFGTSISVRVRTIDAAGNFGAPTRTATTVELTMRVETTSGHIGTTRVTRTGTIAAGGSQIVFSGITYPVAENSVVATARTTAGDVLTPDKTRPFDVVTVLATGQADTTLLSTGGNAGAPCADTTRQDPTCVTVYLDNGANSTYYLQESPCQIDPTDSCVGSLISLVAGLFDSTTDPELTDLFKYPDGTPRYTATHPATLVIEWDKSISGNQGVPKLGLEYAFEDDSEFQPAPDCVSSTKGTVNPPPLCIDRKNRQGDGDLEYTVIFFKDLRTRSG